MTTGVALVLILGVLATFVAEQKAYAKSSPGSSGSIGGSGGCGLACIQSNELNNGHQQNNGGAQGTSHICAILGNGGGCGFNAQSGAGGGGASGAKTRGVGGAGTGGAPGGAPGGQ